VGPTILATALSFAANIGTIVDQLQAAGAQHIVVWDTPNIGLAPAVVAAGGASLGSFLAASMNAALAQRLAGEVGVSTFDIFGLGTAIALDPLAFGFTNITDACGAVSGANCNSYVYWDGIHRRRPRTWRSPTRSSRSRPTGGAERPFRHTVI
jgi:outer membrane lipase/esterase